MRQTLSRGVVVAAAATSILSLYDIPALADSFAGGATSDSPGVLSGNTLQVPIHVPINACGNSVDVIGLLNPAFGNSCGNQANSVGQVTPDIPRQTGSSDTASPQTPPQTCLPTPPPTGVANTPPVARTPAPRPPSPAEQTQRGTASQEPQYDSSSTYRPRPADATPMGGESRAALAETGSGTMLATSGVSAALIVGGMILYRRGRAAYFR
ncbi:chaplin family protein [Streptomyces sp. NPDC001982]|uniref:chaplin family protein n=1 Tax=Streptomyces sp. NPDC001982 TaxID=3154405 RepID=UPI00331A660C